MNCVLICLVVVGKFYGSEDYDDTADSFQSSIDRGNQLIRTGITEFDRLARSNQVIRGERNIIKPLLNDIQN